MKRTKAFALILALLMVFGLAACNKTDSPSDSGNAGQPKVLRLAESFAYPSLDAHKEYYGWYTSIYGLTEALFRIDDDMSIKPLLAEKYEMSADGKVWTIKLNSKAAFSNGTALKADMVVRNLQRVAKENKRFSQLGEFTIAATDETTITINTPNGYPTLLCDLAAPECAIMDLDATTDFDKAPIGTGPFVIKSFEPEGTVEVEKNKSYWNGDVKLDGAIFYYMQDDDSKLNAMQNGEIDGYTSVTAVAKEIYAAKPDQYTVTDIPGTRLQFYALNQKNLDSKVREAVNLTVNCNDIAAYLKGTVSAATGPFITTAPYGKVTKPAPDTNKAKALLEQDGYKLNANGIYEKNGKPLTLNICYYEARSLDSIALLMQQQLKAVGIDSKLTVQEDADTTYVATGDFDIALYCMIADKAGDPFYCVNELLSQKSRWAVSGFKNDECEKLIAQLKNEADPAKRAQLTNQIVQISIDENAYGYVGLFNKITVVSKPKGVKNIAENCPFDFYRIDANTTMD
ncbi:MAG: ABC transporter substrate-binding protein [Clostridia bacterium]|nr:ABC transporter substrate-binding protein [Clostridia bacterium]